MQSNWPVVYNAGTPWNAAGPFEQYAAAAEVKGRKQFGLCRARLGREDSFLVFFARGVVLCPEVFPAEASLRVNDFVALSVRVKIAAGVSDDTLLLASIGRVVDAGPKLFRPTPDVCEPLEQVEVGLTAAEIALPFPACVVEFPPDYAADRIVPSPADAASIRPEFVVVIQENGVVAASLVMAESPGRPARDIYSLSISGSTAEVILRRSGEVNPQLDHFVPFVRVALNFLMLAAGGHRLIGPANPAQARSLRERIKRARKVRNKDKLGELRTRLRRLPSVFTLAQEVSLFDRESLSKKRVGGYGLRHDPEAIPVRPD